MTTNISAYPVVAGVDGSESALQAAHWAADEAIRRHVPLRLVHAVNTSSLGCALGLETSLNYDEFVETLESDGRQRLAEAENALRQAHPELDLDVELLKADPIPALIELSGGSRLIVLGSRGLGGFTGILAGSTTIALVARARCPIAVIRGRTDDAPLPVRGAVVVGVDGSPVSEPAIEVAFEEAALRRADLVAVHTWTEFSSDSAYAYAHRFNVDWDAIDSREHESLAERMAGWQEKYPDVVVRRVVARDRPVRCLLKYADDAQLLVVGSRGHGGFPGMLLGSTSQALIHHAPCPLLVVHPLTAE